MKLQPGARRLVNVVSPLLNETPDPYASDTWRDRDEDEETPVSDGFPDIKYDDDELIAPDLGPDREPDEFDKEFIESEGLVEDEHGAWVFPEDV